MDLVWVTFNVSQFGHIPLYNILVAGCRRTGHNGRAGHDDRVSAGSKAYCDASIRYNSYADHAGHIY